MRQTTKKIVVVGLGYVGLPLALAFGEKFDTLGFDISKERIETLKRKKDINIEVSERDFNKSKLINFSSNEKDLLDRNIFIISVPTPIYSNKKLDIRNIVNATKTVTKYIKKNAYVIYESTVYPGFTEDVCLPILKQKGIKYNTDFYIGYSPERINPGDKKHTLKKIVKITSGSNKKATIFIDKLYKEIIEAGTHSVSNIKIAEAAKVIENAQRDINIAFVNELTKIFDKTNIDTGEVLKAANTKWNFLDFKPGFVGGHCIGVDPYYLNYLAEKNKIETKIILNGRNVNDSMADYTAKKIHKILKANNKNIKNTKILLLGYTFKENCNDYRNTMTKNIYKILKKKTNDIHISDPYLSKDIKINGLKFIETKKIKYLDYGLIAILVKHDYFKNLNINNLLNNNIIIYDFHDFLKIKKTYKF